MVDYRRKNIKRILESKKVKEAYATLRVLSGRLRFKIVILLSHYQEGFSVTELAKILSVSLSTVSHQLRVLRLRKFVTAMAKNREVIYKIADHRIRRYLKF